MEDKSQMYTSNLTKVFLSIIEGYFKSHKAGCECNECYLTRLFLHPETIFRQQAQGDVDAFQELLSHLCYMLPEHTQSTGRPRSLFMPDAIFALVLREKLQKPYRKMDSVLERAKAKGLITSTAHYNTLQGYSQSNKIIPALLELYNLAHRLTSTSG